MKSTIKYTVMLLSAYTYFNISCTKDYSDQSGCIASKVIVANAGIDQLIALPRNTALFTGSVSADPCKVYNVFKWKKILGPASFNITTPDSARTLITGLAAGIYEFEFTVTGNNRLALKDTIQIVVIGLPLSNYPPVANAGPHQTIALPDNATTLDGVGSSDPDNNIINYSWVKISGPTSLTIGNSATARTSVSDLIDGIYKFELTVTDAGGLVSKDSVQVVESTRGNTGNYFPLTIGFNWHYYFFSNFFVPDYAINRVIAYSPVFNGDIYSAIVSSWTAGTGNADDTFYYRNAGGNYYEYANAFGFDKPVFSEYIFLKDNVVNGTTCSRKNFFRHDFG